MLTSLDSDVSMHAASAANKNICTCILTFFSENNQYAYIYFNMLPILIKIKGDSRESAISGVLFYPNLIETSSDGELRLALDTWMFTASSSLICFSSDLAMLFS